MPPDDPPRRRTPSAGRHDPVLPRPSTPDLYELFETWLREYRGEHSEGISNRTILGEVRALADEVRLLGTEINTVSERVATLEGGERVRLHTGNTGQFQLPPPAAAPAPVRHSSFFTRFGTTLGEQVSKYLLPAIIAAMAGIGAAHGCK